MPSLAIEFKVEQYQSYTLQLHEESAPLDDADRAVYSTLRVLCLPCFLMLSIVTNQWC